MPKITEEMVSEIQRLADQGLSQYKIAEQLGIQQSAVCVNLWALRTGQAPKDYYRHHQRKRQAQPANQAMAYLITSRLEELVQTRAWLAEQLPVGKNAVSNYANGTTLPDEYLQGEIFRILGYPYTRTEEYLEEIT